jgi:hypothetical protein
MLLNKRITSLVHSQEFDAVKVDIPAGVASGERLDLKNKTVTIYKRQVRINILPSKIFKRDGDNVQSTLKLSATEAEEGGPFEIETLFGKDMVFLESKLTNGHTHRWVVTCTTDDNNPVWPTRAVGVFSGVRDIEAYKRHWVAASLLLRVLLTSLLRSHTHDGFIVEFISQ